MKFIDFQEGGEPSSLYVAECDAPKLETSQVLVEVKSFGINRADTLQRKGMYPAPKHESSILGLEVSGVVSEVGNAVTKWKPGDFVFGLVAGGGYAEFAAVEEDHLMSIPANVDFNEAAGVAEVFLTAYQALFELANIKRNQRVLIHAGASGVGLAAIQLAVTMDCDVAVTSSSLKKLDACASLGATTLINYQELGFRREVKESLGCVDIIVDVVGASYVNENVRLLNMDGTIVQLAMLGGRYVESFDMAMMLSKRATIKASTLRNRSDAYKTQLIKQFSQQYLSLFEMKKLKPIIDTVFSANDIAEAHSRFESNDSIGKFIGTWE
ncbi:NAD(P)H-quinone oxidoreductase [Alteromonadaceae bacterium M269]|nr:NAD(P)H-quinone oxidoreductase [Alteromonadaceae bacterium M269]